MKGAEEPLTGAVTGAEGIWRVPQPDESSPGLETADLLHRHPPPWRLVERTNVIYDSNDQHVVTLMTTTKDLEVIAEALIALVNYPRKWILGIEEDV